MGQFDRPWTDTKTSQSVLVRFSTGRKNVCPARRFFVSCPNTTIIEIWILILIIKSAVSKLTELCTCRSPTCYFLFLHTLELVKWTDDLKSSYYPFLPLLNNWNFEVEIIILRKSSSQDMILLHTLSICLYRMETECWYLSI